MFVFYMALGSYCTVAHQARTAEAENREKEMANGCGKRDPEVCA